MSIETNKIEKYYQEFYKRLINNKKNVFIGNEQISSYLSYVLNDLKFSEVISGEDFSYEEGVLYVIEKDITYKQIPKNCYISMNELLNIIDDSPKNIQLQGKKVLFWGCGNLLRMHYCDLSDIEPAGIIDKNGNTINNLPIIEFNEKISKEEYYIIITAQNCKDEIKNILEQSGWQEDCNFAYILNVLMNKGNKDMFIKTIYDKPIGEFNCTRPFDYVNVGTKGLLAHCCYNWLPINIGDMLKDSDPFDTIKSRIIRISFFNKTYSFCNTELCVFMKEKREALQLKYEKVINKKEVKMEKQLIKKADIAFDYSCNLYCMSCRNNIILDKSKEKMQIAEKICNVLMPNLENIVIAGNGEVFLSEAYLKIISQGHHPKTNLQILSNGNLFSEDKFDILKNRFKSVSIAFSIDAATKETYEIIRRGGKWEKVLNALYAVQRLKQQGYILKFNINFVVSSLNYKEMPLFVELGKKYDVDRVLFSRIENWGTYTEDEFKKISMFNDEGMKPELKSIVDMPIMKDKRVWLMNF